MDEHGRRFIHIANSRLAEITYLKEKVKKQAEEIVSLEEKIEDMRLELQSIYESE